METRNLKVLVVENRSGDLIAFGALMEEAFPAATVLTVTTGQDGIDLAGVEDPDAILLDIAMPGMGAFDVCRRLKADARTRDIPVIFLMKPRTGRESRMSALEAGGEAFLSKRIDASEVYAQVRAMVKIKAANRAQRNEQEEVAVLVAGETQALEQELAARKRVDNAQQRPHRTIESVSGCNEALLRATSETGAPRPYLQGGD